jgi:hypothetical protein
MIMAVGLSTNQGYRRGKTMMNLLDAKGARLVARVGGVLYLTIKGVRAETWDQHVHTGLAGA